MTYDELINSKLRRSIECGFEPLPILTPLYEWQAKIVKWAVKRGRVALFEECGLGKTIQQIEWASQVVRSTCSSVLILCPLAVSHQTIIEGCDRGVKITALKEVEHFGGPGIYITNYEKLEKILEIVPSFSGVVLDESSILKGLTGKTRWMLTEVFSNTPYRLCCTATPAPNDFTELGQHAEFLGVSKYSEMLAEYFINDTFDTGTWRLKKHAVDTFWKWVASWAACVTKPSDIGFSDEGYDLPPVTVHDVIVPVDHRGEPGGEELFAFTTPSATQIHAHNRKTAKERCEAAAEIVNQSEEQFVVWCESNIESDLLSKLIPEAVEVKGSDSSDRKEERLNGFSSGKYRVIITKPSIAGFGLNWQHCRNDVYVGLSYSFESFYQASKRIHRFGQKRPINRYIIQTDSENGVIQALQRKQNHHNEMRDLMHFTAQELNNTSNIITMNTSINFRSRDKWKIYNGDCVRVAEQIESDSIGFSVFSPPFADLFTYSSDIQDMGNCKSLDDFMIQFGFLVDQLKRIMMPGRHVAVHCCDLMSAKWKDGNIELKDFSGILVNAFRKAGFLFHSRITIWKDPVTEMQRTKAHGLLYKTLKKDSTDSRVGAPDYLLVFRKPGDNPVPVTHTEHDMPLALWQEIASPVWTTVDQGNVLNGKFAREASDEKHICPLQLDVINRALHLWSAPDDLVFSPFTGIGSEGYCAIKMGRRFVGSELKRSYWETACDYLIQAEQTADSLFKTAL